jgi:hypothetical protein
VELVPRGPPLTIVIVAPSPSGINIVVSNLSIGSSFSPFKACEILSTDIDDCCSFLIELFSAGISGVFPVRPFTRRVIVRTGPFGVLVAGIGVAICIEIGAGVVVGPLEAICIHLLIEDCLQSEQGSYYQEEKHTDRLLRTQGICFTI